MKKTVRRLFRLSVLVLLLGGWSLAAASLHVVRTPGKIVVIPKQAVDWRDWRETYVDTRKWTMDDAAAHKYIVNWMIARGKTDLLQNVAPDSKGELLKTELQAAIDRGPQVKSPTTKPASA